MGATFKMIETEEYDDTLLDIDHYMDEFLDCSDENVLSLLALAHYRQDYFVERSLQLIADHCEDEVEINYYSKEEIIEAFEQIAAGEGSELYDDICLGLMEVLQNSMTFEHAIEDYINQVPSYDFQQVYIRDLIDFVKKKQLFVQVSARGYKGGGKEIFLNAPLQNIW